MKNMLKLMHLSHKIAWKNLELVLPDKFNVIYRKKLTFKENNRIRHFVETFLNTVYEFYKSDNNPYPSYYDMNDTIYWDQTKTSYGGYMSPVDSIIRGYIIINLLIDNFEKYGEHFIPQKSWVMAILLGKCDGGHPKIFSDKIKVLFDDFQTEWNSEITAKQRNEILVKYSKDLFRLIYLNIKRNYEDKDHFRNRIYNAIRFIFPFLLDIKE